MTIEKLKLEINSCKICAPYLLHAPRPVVRFNNNASLLIIGQAPGSKVHNTGIPWNDRSGDRLRNWLNLTSEEFYDENKVAIVPMGFCYPGVDKNGGDNPPRKECAPLWHSKIRVFLPTIKLTLLVGFYAQKYYLNNIMKANMTKTVKAWQEYLPDYIPIPHPSWRNTGWINRNSWFSEELIPVLQKVVKEVITY